MTPEELQCFITSFRGWLDNHGAPCLTAEHAALLVSWHQELAADSGGTGIKRRMLDTLEHCTGQHAPSLFINMRMELAEGVTVLQGSMKPQLSGLIAYGEGMLKRFGQNTRGIEPPTAEVKGLIEGALVQSPAFPASL